MTTPAVETQQLRVRYGPRVILDGLDLVVPAGRITAVLGLTGSGKTTLLRALHLLAPYEGRVRWFGAPPPTQPKEKRALLRRMGFVQQRPGFLTGTVAQNVEAPLAAKGVERNRRRQVARDMLERVGLEEHADRPAALLSGGQLQRAALARSLVHAPDLLFMDEPTNQLDTQTEIRMELLIREAAEGGAAVVLVTHDPAQAQRLADATLHLHEGRITGP